MIVEFVIREKEEEFQFDSQKHFEKIKITFEKGLTSISKQQISQLISIARILKSRAYKKNKVQNIEIVLPSTAPDYIDLHFFNYTLFFHHSLGTQIQIVYPYSDFSEMKEEGSKYFSVYSSLSQKIDSWPNQTFSKSKYPNSDISNKDEKVSMDFIPALFINGNLRDEYSFDFWFNQSAEPNSIDVLKSNVRGLQQAFNSNVTKRKNKKDLLLRECQFLLNNHDWIYKTDKIFSKYSIISLTTLHATKLLLKDLVDNDISEESEFEKYLSSSTGTKKDFANYSLLLKTLVNEIFNKPRIVQLLFYFLSVQIFNSNEVITKPNQIFSLLLYVERFAFGLKELAKNIIEHTDEKLGIITIELHQKKERGREAELKVTVSDIGTRGIVEKATIDLKEKLNLLSGNSRYKSIIRKDIKFLESSPEKGRTLFNSYFDVYETSLESQFIKTAASYGLMIFSNVVFDQNGQIQVYSQNLIGGERGYSLMVSKKSSNPKDHSIYRFGNHFEISIPVQLRSFQFESKVISEPKIVANSESAFMQALRIQSLESPPKYPLDPEYQYGLVYLNIGKLVGNSSHFDVSEKMSFTENLKKKVTREVTEARNYSSQTIICLDFEGYTNLIDSSVVLRFLSFLQAESTFKYVIINRLDEIVASELVDLLYMLEGRNSKSESHPSNKFWNAEHYVLFVSQKLQFSVCLLNGASSDEFEFTNSLINRTHELMPFLNEKYEYKGTYKSEENEKKVEISKTPFFSVGGFLTPIELILNGVDEDTIFEDLAHFKLKMLMR